MHGSCENFKILSYQTQRKELRLHFFMPVYLELNNW